MKNITHIYEPMFGVNVYYVNCKTDKEFKKIAMEKFNTETGDHDDVDGRFCVTSAGVYILWASKDRIQLVAHECMHAVIRLLAEKNIPLRDETEEVYACLLGFLMKEIYG